MKFKHRLDKILFELPVLDTRGFLWPPGPLPLSVSKLPDLT